MGVGADPPLCMRAPAAKHRQKGSAGRYVVNPLVRVPATPSEISATSCAIPQSSSPACSHGRASGEHWVGRQCGGAHRTCGAGHPTETCHPGSGPLPGRWARAHPTLWWARRRRSGGLGPGHMVRPTCVSYVHSAAIVTSFCLSAPGPQRQKRSPLEPWAHRRSGFVRTRGCSLSGCTRPA